MQHIAGTFALYQREGERGRESNGTERTFLFVNEGIRTVPAGYCRRVATTPCLRTSYSVLQTSTTRCRCRVTVYICPDRCWMQGSSYVYVSTSISECSNGKASTYASEVFPPSETFHLELLRFPLSLLPFHIRTSVKMYFQKLRLNHAHVILYEFDNFFLSMRFIPSLNTALNNRSTFKGIYTSVDFLT